MDDAKETRRRRDVLDKYAGALTGVYTAGELDTLRSEWPLR
jgi:hypothetical protein